MRIANTTGLAATIVIVGVLGAPACHSSSVDDGLTDSGTADAGSTDAGVTDAGSPDGGAGGPGGPGTGSGDAGGSCDAGVSATCFSMGYWDLQNIEPCFLMTTTATGDTVTLAYASTPGTNVTCPFDMNTGMPTVPSVWSTDTLEVDCAGTFQLCYTLKAGDPAHPSSTDCVIGRSCVTAVYPGPHESVGDTIAVEGLPGWESDAGMADCVTQFLNMGGYGQMSVAGETDQCESVNKAFQTVTYCPTNCTDPDAGLCGSCQAGGGGPFGN